MKKTNLLVLMIVFVSVLFAQQMMSPPAGECNFTGEKGMTIIPFELMNNQIIIKANLNGKNTVRLVLDTGMPAHGALLYETKQIKEMNLSYSGRAMVGSPGGEMKPASILMGANLTFPEVEFSGINVIVMPYDEISIKRFTHTDGVIGYSIFNRFVVELDFEKKLMTLTKPEIFQYKGNGKEYEVEIVRNTPVIAGIPTLENGVSESVQMVIDLGATHAFSLQVQKDVNIQPPAKILKSKAVGASGEFEIIRGRIPKFKVGDFQFENVLASFNGEGTNPFPDSEEKGNLGMEILRRFDLVIDYNGKWIFLEPNKYYNDPFETNMSGIVYYRNEQNQLVVENIYDNSTAAEADIQLGDLIMQINGKAIEKFSINDLTELFQQEGKSLKLTILRDDEEITKKVKLRRLI